MSCGSNSKLKNCIFSSSAMEALAHSSSFISSSNLLVKDIRVSRPGTSFGCNRTSHSCPRLKYKVRAVTEVVSESLNSAPVGVTWEIVVGAIAGTTPFVVAGIEFSKRINAQRNCAVCKGSGLVRREKYFFRCPRCGGFLPWQSWNRFLTG